MDTALHNDSTLLPISSFLEFPVVLIVLSAKLTLWTCRASGSSISANNVPCLTLQVWTYCPENRPRFDKEVAIIRAFQFENLREKEDNPCHQLFDIICFYRLATACQLGALVLPFTLSLNLLGFPGEAHGEAAGGRVVEDVAGQAGVGFIVFSGPKLPAGGGRLVGLNSHTCL